MNVPEEDEIQTLHFDGVLTEMSVSHRTAAHTHTVK